MLEELRRHWPPEGQILLLQAALADLDTARRAWRQWQSGPDLADASWGEVCLLAALGRRMPDLGGDAPPDPRVVGARRHIWTRTQMTYASTRPLLATLRAEGLRLMLMKGAARLAADPALARDRALRDADVLVHPDDWERSVELARREGWVAVKRRVTVSDLRRLHSVGLHSPNPRAKGEFDLHRYVLRECMNEGQDLGLWERAVATRFLDVDVLTPAATDFALISLGQSMLFSPFSAPYWAIDLDPLIQRGTIDWDVLLGEVRMRRLETFIAAPLLLLRERIGTPVPDDVLRALTQRLSHHALVEFAARATGHGPRTAEQFDARRIMHTARAMRVARARSARDAVPPQAPPPAVRRAKLGESEELVIPVPRGGSPFARRRLYISFLVHHARGHARLNVTASGISLKAIPLERAGTARGGRVRRLVVITCPACLFDLRDVAQVRLTASRVVLYNVYAGWSRPRMPALLERLTNAWRRRRDRLNGRSAAD
jgi:hypothetical protein